MATAPGKKQDNDEYKYALSKSNAHFYKPSGSSLLERTQKYFDWQNARRNSGLWSLSRSIDGVPQPNSRIKTEQGDVFEGINFASQDYLSLTSHPQIFEAAVEALKKYGPHSAGSPMLVGNTTPSLALEKALSEILQMEHIILFPTGWGAGFGVISSLVRQDDYVLLDNLSHACLQQGAYSATKNVFCYKHLDIKEVTQQLQVIRASDTRNGILVVTESLFSMDSDSPDIQSLQEVCRQYSATLLIDIAHDFGAMGSGGTGFLGIQKMLGKVDLVMGSFSKTFASNGGFVASHSPSVKQFIKTFGGTHVFSNAISPMQAAVVLEALKIVRSSEGEQLRLKLAICVKNLRDNFQEKNIFCMGNYSPIVPVLVGSEKVARVASALLLEKKVFANLIEFPAVAVNKARFRLQVMACHTATDTQKAAIAVSEVISEAKSIEI
jgi:7-keto-8-aminopelargonate synthetase-like enzyme